MQTLEYFIRAASSYNLTNSILPCSILQLKLILSFVIAKEKMDSSEGLMYNVDLDGGTLLHLAANSGVLAVSLPKQFPLYALDGSLANDLESQ